MSWSLVIAVVVLAIAGFWWWKQNYHWRRLERLVGDLAAGKQPATFVFHGSARFTRIARELESLAVEQNRLKKSVEEEKFNFEAILASMAEGVMVVDHEHKIRLVNDAFRKLFPLKGDPLGQSVLSAVREASIEELVRATLDSGELQTREISPPHQPVRHFAASAVPLPDAAGKISGVVSVFHDISRLRQLEEVRREFIANVSHELRTPLSIFHGYLENLLDNPTMVQDEREGILAIMRKHSLRLNALLEDLLTIARLESRRESLDLSDIRFEPFIRQVLNDWRLKLEEGKILADVHIAPDLPPLAADAFRLEQVFNNLIENAIKFTPAGGSIIIKAEARGPELVVRFADTGAGIPPSDLPHVFEPFYRVEKARSREAGGTGLGLSIVKHIVGLHGGTVQAESVLGGGATIILRLPCAR